MIAAVKLVNEQFMGEFYFRKDQEATARGLLAEGHYRRTGPCVVTELQGEAAAEEIFDLTNNPGRQAEREERWGHFRSVSVGDIVNVNGQDYLCASMGWKRL
jgi:hypothetical protein